MKISIVGGGNMGGAIAAGLISSNYVSPEEITVINRTDKNTAYLKSLCPTMQIAINEYDSITSSDIVILAVKPWLIEQVVKQHIELFSSNPKTIISVASGITLAQLEEWIPNQTIFRVMPNTAIAIRQSMTFVSSANCPAKETQIVVDLFSELGKVELIDEKLFPAATSLASCGIAYAFRYIRAAMEGGVELGLYPNQARDIVLQTLRGAVELLAANGTHPEAEIDKVTTPGGITIKGLNEMEHAGFTSSVIRGLKASTVK